MISYSTDFELAIWNSLEKIFPSIKHYGCYLHYCFYIGKNIKNKIIGKLKKFSSQKENISIDSILNFKNEIIMLPFIYIKEKNNIENIFIKYLKI